MKRTALRLLLLVIACAALEGAIARRLLLQTVLDPGQIESAAFESIDGQTVLATLPWKRPDQLVTVDFYDHAREVGMPPGWTVSLPLEAGQAYRVMDISRPESVIRIVLGTSESLQEGHGFDGQLGAVPHGARIIRHAVALSVEGGQLALRPWTPDWPWTKELAELDAVRRACAPDGPVAVKVRRSGRDFIVGVGRCSVTAPAAADDGRLAVVAGFDATSIRKDGRWTYRWLLSDGAFLGALACLVGAVAAAIAFDGALAVVAVATLALASLVFPFEALVVLILLIPVVALTIVLRLWLRLRWMFRVPTAMVALLALAAMIGGLRHKTPDVWGGRARLPAKPPGCVVLGYSTMAGVGLRFATQAVRDDLRQSCSACNRDAALIATGGEKLDFIDREACDFAARSTNASSHWIFVGGTNDDVLWSLDPRSIGGLRILLSVARRIVFDSDWLDKPGRFTNPIKWTGGAFATSSGRLDEQLADARDAMGCVTKGGGRFEWLHDYLITDLRDGRSPERQRMVAARAATARAAGASFVDLLDATRDRASISWFNDQIHLTTRAHREVANLACAAADMPGAMGRTPP